ncbi:glutaredoxin 3 [Vibrio sp. NTOU-M3]|uniref:glutaredoxin 3 n=1 Tax=unclassified Vibrio TaxID=2614977 RepID=UPI00349F59E6
MSQIILYTKHYCPHCKAAKLTLKNMGLAYQEIDVSDSPSLFNEMTKRSQRKTVPQIFVGTQHIGGNQDLNASIHNGHFEQVLTREGINR